MDVGIGLLFTWPVRGAVGCGDVGLRLNVYTAFHETAALYGEALRLLDNWL